MEQYDQRFITKPLGFVNLGHTCYFNALLQSILSCSSFNKAILDIKNDDADDIINLLKKYIKYSYDDRLQNADNYAIYIWKAMMIKQSKEHDMSDFANKQQCSSEGFQYFIDCMPKNIQKLFIHRHRSMIYCTKCEKRISLTYYENNMLEIQHDFKSEQLEQFKHLSPSINNLKDCIANQYSYVTDFKCSECGDVSPKFKFTKLVKVPEILIVISKKYNIESKLDVYTDFSETLSFEGYDHKKKIKHPIKYLCVSLIEHSGSRDSGHYWSNSLRKNSWYNFNDDSISLSNFKPTNNSYIAFYHFI